MSTADVILWVHLDNGTYKVCTSSLPFERPELSKLVLSQTLFSFLVAEVSIPSFAQSAFIQPFHNIALNPRLGNTIFDHFPPALPPIHL